ncbi:MAG: hypothetical protein KJP17_12610 [Gammaproteobacteria bacterium]|nr:hypothetical protein [Gammaproteobacteria bacterium]
MRNRKLPIIPLEYALIVTALYAAAPFTVLAQDDFSAELQRCSLIDEGSARLDCYDALSGRKSAAASESAEAQQESAVIPEQKTLDEETVDVTAAGQAMVGEAILDEKAADKDQLDQEAVEKETPVEALAEAKTLDDLGSETLPRSSRDEADKLAVRATVSRCEKDYRKKYLFHFDNGQIWKQTSDKRLYFKECNFDVTITKDFFGYKMKADDNKRQIRISRVK